MHEYLFSCTGENVLREAFYAWSTMTKTVSTAVAHNVKIPVHLILLEQSSVQDVRTGIMKHVCTGMKTGQAVRSDHIIPSGLHL